MRVNSIVSGIQRNFAHVANNQAKSVQNYQINNITFGNDTVALNNKKKNFTGIFDVITGKKNKAKTEKNTVQQFAQNLQTETENILKNTEIIANDIQNQAQKVQLKAYEDKETVSKLFKKGSEITSKGKLARTIQGSSTLVMTEFDEDGETVLRKSLFTKAGNLQEIIQFDDKGRENISEFNDNGDLIAYTKAHEQFPDGSTKEVKRMRFIDDKLVSYTEGFEEIADKGAKISKMLNFEDDKVSLYQEGCKISPDGDCKRAKRIEFKDGNLKCYGEGYAFNTEGDWKVDREMNFQEDGNLKYYTEGYKVSANGDWKIDKAMDFKDGKLRCYGEGYEKPYNTNIRYTKEIEF